MPAFDDSRNVHRERTAVGHLLQAAPRVFLRCCAVGRTPCRVEGVYGAGLCVPHDRQQVAADARHARFDDRQHGGRRHGGVNGVAAVGQGAQSRG